MASRRGRVVSERKISNSELAEALHNVCIHNDLRKSDYKVLCDTASRLRELDEARKEVG